MTNEQTATEVAEGQYVSIAAIVKHFGLSRRTVGRMIDAGELIAEEYRGSIRIAIEDFRALKVRKREAAIQAAEARRQAKAVSVVRPVGRPRKAAAKSDCAPKRPVGRPRKDSLSASADSSR